MKMEGRRFPLHYVIPAKAGIPWSEPVSGDFRMRGNDKLCGTDCGRMANSKELTGETEIGN